MEQVYLLMTRSLHASRRQNQIVETTMINFLTNLFNKETQPKSKSNPNKDYWEERYLEERKKVIAKIEELKKVYKEEADIYLKEVNRVMENEMNSATSETEKYNLSAINSDVNERTFKDGMVPKKIRIYNYLKNLAETAQEHDISLVEDILDMIISCQKEENIEKNHAEWMDSQKDKVIKKLIKLMDREKELNEREAKIIKIEAAQKILNSNLLDEINNEGYKND